MPKRSLLKTLAQRIPIEPRGFSPWFVRQTKGPIGQLLRTLFRPSIHGLEQLPKDRPILLVANHSGTGALEVILLAMLWADAFGTTRPATGLAHPLAWYVPGLRQGIQTVGAIPSTFEAGLEALRQGNTTLIFPGGDYEAFRPIWQARTVDFNQRRGFLRLARAANAVIVPVGIWGSHFTAPILWRSKLLPNLLIFPRLVGLKRLPITALSVLSTACVSALLGVCFGPVAAVIGALLTITSPLTIFTPWLPYPVRTHIGTPIEPEDLFADLNDDEHPPHEAWQSAYDRVVQAIQNLVLEAEKAQKSESP